MPRFSLLCRFSHDVSSMRLCSGYSHFSSTICFRWMMKRSSNHAVPMVMAQKPVAELAPPLDYMEETPQLVGDVVSVQLLLDAGGGAVGQNAVRLPAGLFRILCRLLVLRFGGQLLGPPARRKVRSAPFPPCGEDSTRSILSSSPHRKRFAGLRRDPRDGL